MWGIIGSVAAILLCFMELFLIHRNNAIEEIIEQAEREVALQGPKTPLTKEYINNYSKDYIVAKTVSYSFLIITFISIIVVNCIYDDPVYIYSFIPLYILFISVSIPFAFKAHKYKKLNQLMINGDYTFTLDTLIDKQSGLRGDVFYVIFDKLGKLRIKEEEYYEAVLNEPYYILRVGNECQYFNALEFELSEEYKKKLVG